MNTGESPRRLYKYFAPDRSSVLSDALLRYTPLGAFNDPFEGRPEVTALYAESEMVTTIDRMIPEEVKAMHDSLPSHIRGTTSYDQLLSLTKRFIKGQLPEFVAKSKTYGTPAIDLLRCRLDEIVGALCLSEIPDNLLMWAHYAASHTGFVVEFDGHHSYFHEQQAVESDLHHLRRVQYRDTRPSAPLSELDGMEMFFVKSAHWSYEREWRILRALQDASLTKPTTPFPVYLFPFPREAVKSVIIGCRALPATEEHLKHTLHAHPEFRSVKLRYAVPDKTHFHLNLVDAAT
jgi:hypothetical protein